MRTTPIGTADSRPSILRAYCFNTDLVGHAVRILGNMVGGLYQVTKVNINNPDPLESVAIGVIAAKTSPSTCLVVRLGPVAGVYDGLDYGRLLFVDVNAYLSAIPPARPVVGKRMLQSLGYAASSNVIVVNPSQPTLLVAS